MIHHQMRSQLIQKMKKTVQRFNISTETYYHAILLFNVIQLKKKLQHQPEYYSIPIKKRMLQWNDQSDSDSQNYQIKEIETQYINIHHSQMPQKDKLQLTVCLFLVHKLYQPYPVCLTYIMRHLQIDQQYENYLLSLEKEFLIKLAYKIQNMLPSNQTLFACSLWDQFIENIDQSCIDIRFDINSLLSSSKKQIQTSHEIKQNQRQPEFKNIKNQKSFEILCQNIEILVHNKALYDLYLKKSENQQHEDIPQMKKIGISIVYATIIQATNMIFDKKYKALNPKDNSSIRSTNYIDFAFNDFLSEHYGLQLNDLQQQVFIVCEILKKKHQRKENSYKGQKESIKFVSSKNLQSSNKESELTKFLLRKKQLKPKLKNHHHKYHQKGLGNMSISSTKTDQQNLQFCTVQRNSKKHKCRSIVQKECLKQIDKILQSTIHQSNMSQKGASENNSMIRNQIFTIGQFDGQNYDMSGLNTKQNKFYKISVSKPSSKKHNSKYEQIHSIEKSAKSYNLKSTKNKHGKSLINSNSHSQNHKKISQQIGYKVSQFIAIDV